MRESPTFALMDRFKELGAQVSYHDPHVPVVGPTREHMDWAGVTSLPFDAETLSSQDAIVIATHHAAFDLEVLSSHADLIIDTRNAMAETPTRPNQVIKA